MQVAVADPLNPSVIDELGYIVGKEVQVVVASPSLIETLISKYYGGGDEPGPNLHHRRQ